MYRIMRITSLIVVAVLATGPLASADCPTKRVDIKTSKSTVQVYGKVYLDTASLTLKDNGTTQSLGGQASAGPNGSISGSFSKDGNSYTVTFTWTTDANNKMTCKINFSCMVVLPATSTTNQVTGTPTTGMTAVMTVTFSSIPDTMPVDDTFTNGTRVLLYDENGPLSGTDYSSTILSSTITSNGDGTSDWQIQFEVDLDALSSTPDEIYAEFRLWTTGLSPNETVAGVTGMIFDS